MAGGGRSSCRVWRGDSNKVFYLAATGLRRGCTPFRPVGLFSTVDSAYSLLRFSSEVNLSRPRAIPTKHENSVACILSGLHSACQMLWKGQTKWRATGRSKNDFGQRLSWAPLAFCPKPYPKASSFTPFSVLASALRPAPNVRAHQPPPDAGAEPRHPA